jgi:hypothetical protein
MSLAKPLHLRLFLEGQEVPVISAQVQATMFAPVSAAIQVVPLDEVMELKPRTMVHLFFLEEPLVNSTKGEIARQSLSGLRVTNDKGVAQDSGLSDQVYKLLFCGEVVGFSFQKTPMSRAVILQCLDHSSYWDLCQATVMDYGPGGNAFVAKGGVYASNTGLFSSVPTQSPAEKLRSWILSKPQMPGSTDVGGLAGGILRLMEVMGGLRGYQLGVNDFFTIAELRNHLLAQVVAEDNDSTAQKLLNHRVFFEWLNNQISVAGGQITLRDMFKLLCQFIYYSVAPNPVAKYDPSATKVSVKVPASKGSLSASRYFPGIRGTLQDAAVLLDSPSLEKPTLAKVSADLKTKVLAVLPKVKGLPSDVGVRASTLNSVIAKLLQSFMTLSEKERDVQRSTAASLTADLISSLDAAGDKTVTTSEGANYVGKRDDRLRSQIFRPDCFMGAPPVCNVIFPEQYSQLTYDRTFINEVTRVEISVHSQVATPNPGAAPNDSALLSVHLLEPDLRDLSLEVAKHMANKWRILMDHELHTGIVAREEWLPDSFSSGWLRGTSNDAQKKLKQAKLTWSQRVGMHHFFKYRMGARTLNVAGRFMPYLVVGFPSAVIQKPFYVNLPTATEEEILDRIRLSQNPAGELGAPPQFLGMIESLTHSVGQDGGHTTVALSHCRSHLGIDDEFIGKLLDRTGNTKTKTQVVHWTLSYKDAVPNEKLLSFLRDCTPQGPNDAALTALDIRKQSSNAATYDVKTISKGVETTTQKSVAVQSLGEGTTKSSSNTSFLVDSASPFGAAGDTIKVPSPPGIITVGSTGLKGGKVKLVQALPPYNVTEVNGVRYFTSIMIHEEVAVPYSQSTDPRVPVEYVVRPSWLSTSYDNENIGPRIYQKFFGCASVVDQIITQSVPAELRQVPTSLPEDGLDTSFDEDVKALQARIKTIDQKRSLLSIETALNFIAYLYGKVRSEHLDVDEFIESFTRRPVASKRELLGSHDLAISVSGSSVNVVSGTLGFHSLSVHPATVKAGNLTGLMDNPVMRLARMGGEAKRAVAASYDVRAKKLEKVEAYLAALTRGNRGYVG